MIDVIGEHLDTAQSTSLNEQSAEVMHIELFVWDNRFGIFELHGVVHFIFLLVVKLFGTVVYHHFFGSVFCRGIVA